MNSITAINTIRDNLRTNLTDPYVTAGASRGTGVHWIFADEPLANSKYPVLQIRKVNNPTTVMTIGSSYWEQEELYLSLWFNTKNGFKVTVSGTEYLNANLVEYYQDLIKTTLKAQFNTLHTAGVGGYKHINTSSIEYDPTTQIYFGNVTIRVWYFRT